MQKRTLIWTGMIGVIMVLISAGCSLDRYLPIDSGYYVVQQSREREVGHPPPWIQAVEIDRDRKEVILTLRKGDPVQVPYLPREQTDWPAGCPGNLFSQHMEVFDLQVNEEQASALVLEDPILVRNCPGTPYQLVLREEGELGGPFTACPYPEDCLYFYPSHEAEPER